MCLVDLEKAFDRVPRKVGKGKEEERNTINHGYISDSLYQGVKTRVRVDSELSEECEVKVGMHQGSLPSPFHFAVVVDVTEFARGALSELQHGDDLVLMSETI